MERLKRLFPNLAHMERIEVAMLPLGIMWLVLVLAALLHFAIWPNGN